LKQENRTQEPNFKVQDGSRTKGVFGLAFKKLLLLKKSKAKPNGPAFFQVLSEKLIFHSSIVKAP
jgi:hypothetical protein